MNTTNVEVQKWWAKTTMQKRVFYQKVMRLVQRVGMGQALCLQFNGRNFTPMLVGESVESSKSSEMKPIRRMEPAQWWGNLSDGMRGFVWELARLVEELVSDQDMRVEILRTEHGLKADLVFRFNRPVGGEAEVN